MYALGVKYHRAGVFELLMQMQERMALEPKGLVALYYDCMHAETKLRRHLLRVEILNAWTSK